MEKINISTMKKKLNRLLVEQLQEQQKPEIITNLKRNWYFPISAMAFFCLNATLTLGYFIGLVIAFVASLIIASQIPSISIYAKKNNMRLQVVSMLTAFGICWGEQEAFYADWSVSPQAQALEVILPISINISSIVSVIGAVFSVFFVYFCVLIFWKQMLKVFSEVGIFSDIGATEWIIYGVLLMVFISLMIVAFAQTEAFYGTDYAFDIIYTSDSPSLVKGNVYLALTHAENDLRQPLFAVFAAPFIGIPYLFGRLFGTTASVQAMLVNSVQVILLFVANFILTKMMKLSPMKRICFILLTCCTYTHLLFTLMMEQYIVAYFWLILCLYFISKKQQPDRIALWGAGGTMLTSIILLPFMTDNSPIRNFKEWFMDMVKYGIEFVILMLVFCRFDVIFYLITKISTLREFTGRGLTMMDKIFQYIEFVSNCFVAPNAGVNTTAVDHISWQLNTVTGLNIAGVIILLLVVISIIWNRDKKSCLLAAGWIGFSVIILVGLGWGTKENGLILYALYFGWAFLVLLFQLVEKIEKKMNVKYVLPLISVFSAVVLGVINVPAIIEMVNFAITYFPA